MKAPHTGAVRIEAGGEEVELRYTWAAMSALHGEFGERWDAAVEEAFGTLDLPKIAKVLEAGSDRSAAWWIESSPPLVPTANAAREALHLAFFGNGEVGHDQADPLMRRAAISLGRLFGRGARSAEPRRSSGP